jgi:general secretion pathway protein D
MRLARVVVPGLVLAFLGCATYTSQRRAQIAEQRGDFDQAVLEYMQALAADPDNLTVRAELMRAKISASQAHFEKAKSYQAAGLLDRALVELQQAVELDPSNQYADVELQKVRDALRARSDARAPAATLEELKERTRGARAQPPVLDPRSSLPISLDFPEPVPVLDIYRALGKAFGINVLFDPNLRGQEIAIELKDVTAQEALEILMRASGHFYKVYDEHSIIIAADTPQNRRIYEDLLIQTFPLSNSEVKDVMQMLRSLVDAKKIAVNEQLNAIVVRDTADRVKVAERIIQANDKSKAEVVIDVELLQINTTKLRELGMSLNPYRITQSLDLGGADVPLRFSDLESLNQNNWTLTIPGFVYDFVKQSGDAQLLAKPQVRISEGETAKLHIGDRVPIPVTTFNTGQTVGGNIVPITSFQYQDVGIKIDIEPRVHHNKEVTLKLKVEVSNLAGNVEGAGGQRQPIIGTRTIESTIRLQDGETNFLAGLIRTDASDDRSGIPGLSDIPVLGRLFTKSSTRNLRTDLILTLTPHIIRTPNWSEQDLLPIWVGTEANITFRGGSPRAESDIEGPFEEEADPEQIRELIRRRLENLPRGLQQEEGEPVPPEDVVPPETQPGIELAPAAPPSDIFREPESEPEAEEPPDEEPPASSAAVDAAEDEVLWAAPVVAASLTSVSTVPAAAGAPAAVGAAASAAVRLRLVASRALVSTGELVEVELRAESLVPVSHLPLALTFDPAVLAVESVVPGDFLGPAGTAQVLSDFSRPGELLLGASRLGRVPGVAGSGPVVRITFRALAPGRATVRFRDPRALDSELRPIGPLAAPALRLDVGPERPVPDKRPPAEGARG